ncbi:MAG: hypothetical protein GX787_05110, partial [Tissierellia bacterium]|nr:hypothetical protein [Tissierellia bacterium]
MGDKFHSRIEKYEKIKDKLNKSINTVATIRLLDFLLILFLAYKYVEKGTSIYLYSLLTAIGLLVYLVLHHGKLKKTLRFANSMILINQRYLDRLNDNWVNFGDHGEDFVDKTHAYSNDLDIVGKSSLFQRINLAHNYIGRNALAKDLLNKQYNKDEILNRQNAIEELSHKLDFIQNLEYESMNTKILNPEDLISYFENSKEFTYSNNTRLLINFLPLLTLTSLALFFILKISSLFLVPFLLVTIQILLWLIGLKKNDSILEKVGLFK